MRLTAPLHIHWEITNMCNYSCIHCYQKNDKMRYNLSPNQLMDIAMKMVKAGVFQVSISGGEPFLIKNIEDIVSFLVYHNIDVLICSNGSILEDKHIDMLKKYRVPIQISLDSYNAEKHNKIRNNNTSFEDVISNIKKLINNDINLSVAFCATKYNYRNICGLIELCVNLKIKKLVIGEVMPIYGNFGKNYLMLTSEMYIKLFTDIKRAIKKYNDLLDIYINSEWGFIYDQKIDHAPCTALDRDFAILYNGYVSPCPFIRNPNYFIGNVLEYDIVQLWNLAKETNFYKYKHSGCMNECQFFEKCLAGCKADLANNNLNIERRDPRCPLK